MIESAPDNTRFSYIVYMATQMAYNKHLAYKQQNKIY